MILKPLSRKERTSKIDAIAKSKENQLYSLYYDYYRGTHFIKTDVTNTDYGHNAIYRITTRSGTELFDEFTQEDKVVVKANWCAPIIETIGDYTRGINEDILITAEEKEDELQKIWAKNHLNTFTHELSYDAGIFGKSFIKIRRREPGAPIELTQTDPGAVYEVKNPITDETESVIYWFGIDKPTAVSMFPNVPMIGEGTGEVYYFEEWDNERVYKYIDGYPVNEINADGAVRDINPYGFIPFVEVPGNIYKSSDIHDAISLNDELNITLTNINEILRYHAFPMLGPKGTFGSDTPVLSKEQLQEVEISPRTIMPIPMERIGGEGFNDSISKHIEQIEKDISIVSGVPIKILTAELHGNISGIALQRMMGSVLRQAEVRRNYIKNAYKKINNMILTLLSNAPELVEVETDIIFPEMIKIDMSERLDEALKKQTLGISKETIFDELGYEYEDEEGKRQEEFDNSLEKQLRDEELAISKGSQKQSQKGNSTKKGNTGSGNKFAKGSK